MNLRSLLTRRSLDRARPAPPLPATARLAQFLLDEAWSCGCLQFTVCERDGRGCVLDEQGAPVMSTSSPWFVLREALRTLRDGHHPDGPARAERADLPLDHLCEGRLADGADVAVRLKESFSPPAIVVEILPADRAPHPRRPWLVPSPDPVIDALLREIADLTAIIVLE